MHEKILYRQLLPLQEDRAQDVQAIVAPLLREFGRGSELSPAPVPHARVGPRRWCSTVTTRADERLDAIAGKCGYLAATSAKR